ncbi:MAG: hypothetical protein A3J75_04410 [Acidobacteria bacterium RBG_16_68_9]|nr:MAG: hypothetical protein A3J75_04410 [Acidobacteria bacterium RBG_16_68_9]
MRQCVLALPKRRRFFVPRDAALAGRVLGGLLRTVEAQLRASSPGAPANARFGGVTFVPTPWPTRSSALGPSSRTRASRAAVDQLFGQKVVHLS